MANFMQCGDIMKITVPSWKFLEKGPVTYYVIRIDAGNIFWNVERRYNEFVSLHATLVSDHGVTLDILPPKKYFGNKDEMFLEKRRQGLQVYLSTVFRFLQKTMPKPLAIFLGLNKFDVLFIVKELAVKFYEEGEVILSKNKVFAFTPLQIYAIHERLKQPCSTLDLLDQREDFSHVVDLCCQLKEIIIIGGNVPLKGSNIEPNSLPLQLSVFRNLERLELNTVNCNKICDLGSLRSTLKYVAIVKCSLSNLQDFFSCDQIHRDNMDASLNWQKLSHVTVIENSLDSLDASLKLIPNLTSLTLTDNLIHNLNNLQFSSILKFLCAGSNRLQFSPNFEFKPEAIVSLNLSHNGINSLKPFTKLNLLETLNLQTNNISEITEVKFIADLPCLENLVLSGNPVSVLVDYRVHVLEYFGNRAFRICLDNEASQQKELDKVAILRALRISKEKLPFESSSP